MQYVHAALTDVGRKRSHNEDSLAFHLGGPKGSSLDRIVLLVADGMGGHSAGDMASQLAVQTFRERLLSNSEDPAAAFRLAAQASQARIQSLSGGKGVGTTIVGLVVSGDRGWVGHIGDSRAYRIRDGAIEALTRDHSWVSEQLASGNLTPEQAAHHPFRNVLTRSLGTASENQEMDIGQFDVRPGDVYILCSDGLYGLVTDPEIAATALSMPPDQAARYLVDLANARGGKDNITVQVLNFPGTHRTGARKGVVGGLTLTASVMLLLLLWVLVPQGQHRPVLRGPSTPLERPVASPAGGYQEAGEAQISTEEPPAESPAVKGPGPSQNPRPAIRQPGVVMQPQIPVVVPPNQTLQPGPTAKHPGGGEGGKVGFGRPSAARGQGESADYPKAENHPSRRPMPPALPRPAPSSSAPEASVPVPSPSPKISAPPPASPEVEPEPEPTPTPTPTPSPPRTAPPGYDD